MMAEPVQPPAQGCVHHTKTKGQCKNPALPYLYVKANPADWGDTSGAKTVVWICESHFKKVNKGLYGIWYKFLRQGLS
jgi:hypothetical protein